MPTQRPVHLPQLLDQAGLMAAETPWYSPITNLATEFGWRVNHQRPAQERSGKWSTATMGHNGWPDFVFSHPKVGVTLFREIKSATGKPSADQTAWLDSLRASGLNVGIWNVPADWPEIVRVLSFGKASCDVRLPF